MRQFLLLTSEYNFTLQTYAFIASDEIVSAIHLQIRIALQTNMLNATDKHVLCWDEHFGTGDELSAVDERVEIVQLSFSHKHTASYQQLPSRIYVKMIAIVAATVLTSKDTITLRRSKRYMYLDAQQYLRLH